MMACLTPPAFLLALLAVLMLGLPSSRQAQAMPAASVTGGPTVVATITVGSGPTGVGVNPTTNRIYVANHYFDNVSVIDGASNVVITTVSVGSSPDGVGVNPTTNRIYV